VLKQPADTPPVEALLFVATDGDLSHIFRCEFIAEMSISDLMVLA
jgi:hypothetical protein